MSCEEKPHPSRRSRPKERNILDLSLYLSNNMSSTTASGDVQWIFTGTVITPELDRSLSILPDRVLGTFLQLPLTASTRS